MATTGSGRHGKPRGRRRWRRAGYLSAGACAVLAVIAGLGLAGGGSPSAPRPGRVTTAPEFCQAPAVASLRVPLARAVPGSDRDEVEPLGVVAGGREVFVQAWTRRFDGVGVLNLATGRLHRIKAFANPSSDQANGASDGRWLVWAQTYSLTSLDHFTLYAWDSVTGRLRRIARSIDGPDGEPWPSPWHAPAVSGRYAAWAQGYGAGGLVEIRLADLDTGTVTTIRRGHTQPPVFDGDLLIWPESDAPNTQTTLRAYSLTQRRLVELPVALRRVHGTEFVVTDGARSAYPSPDLSRLYYSPHQDQPARLALVLPTGVHFEALAMAPGTLAWTTSSATYVASTRTGVFTKVTTRYGFATGSRSVVLVSDGPRSKQVHPPLPLHVIDPASITWPACRTRAGVLR